MALEYAFELAASSIRVGRGVTREIGMDLAEMNAKRVMVLTDPNLARLSPVATALESLRDNGIQFALFDRVQQGLAAGRCLCGLGDAAGWVIQWTMERFRDEYEEHCLRNECSVEGRKLARA